MSAANPAACPYTHSEAPVRSRLYHLMLPVALLTLSCAPRDDVTAPDGSPGNAGQPVAANPAPVLPSAIRPRIDEALKNVERRDLLASHAFWTIFHGILGLGPDVMLLDERTGE